VIASELAASTSTSTRPDITRATLAAIREGLKSRRRPADESPPELHSIRDFVVPDTAIPARLYIPADREQGRVAFYLHGGGFVLGDLETGDGLCRHIAHHAATAVLAIDYRLAPEAPYPAAVDDCAEVLAWLAKGAAGFDIEVDRIIVIGESAGGALAIEIVGRQSERAAGLALLYPVVDHPNAEHASYDRFATGYGLTRATMMACWEMYLDGASIPTCALPVDRDLIHLPATFVATAAHDVLRDEGEALVRSIAAAGTSAIGTRYNGLHGFIHDLGINPDADRALADLAIWMRAR
jgi:acetyl esterase